MVVTRQALLRATEVTTMDKIFVSVAEAAELCSVSRDVIYQLFADGVLAQCKYGKRTLVAVDELYAWRETLKSEARARTSTAQGAQQLAKTEPYSDYWKK